MTTEIARHGAGGIRRDKERYEDTPLRTGPHIGIGVPVTHAGGWDEADWTDIRPTPGPRHWSTSTRRAGRWRRRTSTRPRAASRPRMRQRTSSGRPWRCAGALEAIGEAAVEVRVGRALSAFVRGAEPAESSGR